MTLVFDYFASDRLDLESRFDMLSSRLVSVLAALPKVCLLNSCRSTVYVCMCNVSLGVGNELPSRI